MRLFGKLVQLPLWETAKQSLPPFKVLALIALSVVSLLIVSFASMIGAEAESSSRVRLPRTQIAQQQVQPQVQQQVQPKIQQPNPPISNAPNQARTDAPFSLAQQANVSGTPVIEYAPAHPTNFGPRFITDAFGRPIYNEPIVVLHETVGSASSAINTFRTPHPRDEDQVSYHALIRRNGSIVFIVPPEYRAFGAGNSVFNGPNGPEAVTLNKDFPPSVNNFAYHVSLETPSDGRNNRRSHSGYTQAQYNSLAWLIAQTNIPSNRITTHQAVDRSRSRMDPRSFDGRRFATLLRSFSASRPG